MRTERCGRRSGSAKRSIATVFRLIREMFTERRAELETGSGRQARPSDTGRSPSAVLLEDIAIENGGRMLELNELANRISVIGFEQFGQHLDIIGAFERKWARARRTRGGRR